MDKHIADILPYATAVALSPLPIAALVLMLLSKKAKINSVAYTIGWIAGLAALVFLVKYLIDLFSGQIHHDTGFSAFALIHFIVGVLLIALAFKELKLRPKKGQEPKMPKWMKAIETFTPLKALMIGFLLATLNVKNTPMGITVGAVIANSGKYETIVFATYLLIASSAIIVPTIMFLFLGKILKRVLENVKIWLINNNATIMFILFLILGVFLISRSFGN